VYVLNIRVLNLFFLEQSLQASCILFSLDQFLSQLSRLSPVVFEFSLDPRINLGIRWHSIDQEHHQLLNHFFVLLQKVKTGSRTFKRQPLPRVASDAELMVDCCHELRASSKGSALHGNAEKIGERHEAVAYGSGQEVSHFDALLQGNLSSRT